MEELLKRLSLCVEMGKINKTIPYPPQLAGQDGAEELAKQALDQGISPDDILHKACVVGMYNIGEKFKQKQVFVPQMLFATKAMTSVMNQLKPFFASGEIKTKGVIPPEGLEPEPFLAKLAEKGWIFQERITRKIRT